MDQMEDQEATQIINYQGADIKIPMGERYLLFILFRFYESLSGVLLYTRTFIFPGVIPLYFLYVFIK